ncbi:MAG TPA: hypothetical protein VE956_20065 [Nodularia sp. (in: cyanobacteria)]|nr:hypothetical protein [Nodularia sp. (in: cyanobacteria)]
MDIDIENFVSPAIILCPSASPEEIEEFVKREEIGHLAMSRFIVGEISFSDYLDCLEVIGTNIDDFLIISNNNCQGVGF